MHAPAPLRTRGGGARRHLEWGRLSESPVLNTEPETLQHTPLDALHRRLGARMVPFAGYAMPVHYPLGVLNEHKHVRTQAGLFDVSHMGQIAVHGAEAAAALEALVPGDMTGLRPGRAAAGAVAGDAVAGVAPRCSTCRTWARSACTAPRLPPRWKRWCRVTCWASGRGASATRC